MKTGLCSITFRQLSAAQVVDVAKKAELDGIEWGGDVHVPPGDAKAARIVRLLTENEGLQVASYGSYYKILGENGETEDFQPVLDSALSLGAKTIRIWAGRKGSDIAVSSYWNRIVDESVRIAKMSATHGVRVAFEFHNNTLTDTNEAAVRLIQDVNQPNVYSYWQPMYRGQSMEYRIQGLQDLKEKILNFHVFHWTYDGAQMKWVDAVQRWPLAEGETDWKKYFSVELPPRDRYALLEFVRNDDPQQFFKDARTLKTWLKGDSE